MQVTTNDIKAFQPFELTIKIESIDELKILYAHLNLDQDQIIEMYEGRTEWIGDIKNCDKETGKICEILFDKLIEFGVK